MRIQIYKPSGVIKRWRLKVDKKTVFKSVRVADLLSKLQELLGTRKTKKVSVSVMGGSCTINESICTTDSKYILSVTACFLEDFINKTTYKKYFKIKHLWTK